MKKFVSLVLMLCIMLAFCGQALAEDKHWTFGTSHSTMPVSGASFQPVLSNGLLRKSAWMLSRSR